MFVPIWILALLSALGAGLISYALYRVKSTERVARTFRAIAEKSSDGLVLLAEDSRVLWVNDAYCKILRRSRQDLIGQSPLMYALPPEDALSAEEARNFRFDPGDARFHTLTQRMNMRGDGERFMHEFSHAVIRDGQTMRVLLAGRDVTERVNRENALIETREILKKLATQDTLTGLHNRGSFRRALEQTIKSDTPFAVLQIDMNDFKAVNDTYGHAAGDAILVHFADLLREIAEDSWTLARIGGDEFTLLLPDVATLDEALTIAEKLRNAARQPMEWIACELRASISVGAIVARGGDLSADEIINRGDIALYTAKEKTGVRIAGYDDELHKKVVQEQKLQRDVVRALDAGDMFFYLQPIVDMHARQVVRFEMLARWSHPKLGIVPPDQFLPVIEQLGLISKFDSLVLEQAIATLRALDDAGLEQVGLSINLSTAAMRGSTIPDELLWMIDKSGFSPNRLAVEILETTAVSLSKNDAVARRMERLRQAGFPLLLDDFGIGYAGLAHLATLNVHGIKIDRQLTSVVDSDENAFHAVAASIDLANKLNVHVISEGTETPEQIKAIMNAGGQYFQGYAIARPMPRDDAITWAKTTWKTWSLDDTQPPRIAS